MPLDYEADALPAQAVGTAVCLVFLSFSGCVSEAECPLPVHIELRILSSNSSITQAALLGEDAIRPLHAGCGPAFDGNLDPIDSHAFAADVPIHTYNQLYLRDSTGTWRFAINLQIREPGDLALNLLKNPRTLTWNGESVSIDRIEKTALPKTLDPYLFIFEGVHKPWNRSHSIVVNSTWNQGLAIAAVTTQHDGAVYGVAGNVTFEILSPDGTLYHRATLEPAKEPRLQVHVPIPEPGRWVIDEDSTLVETEDTLVYIGIVFAY